MTVRREYISTTPNGPLINLRTRFVCVTSQESGLPVVMSSYYSKRRGTDLWNTTKIWEAARATSAASTFFDPITIGDECFVDGVTGANNPIQYLWTEVGDVWKERDGPLENEIKCILSIGTGIPSLQPFGVGLKDVAKGSWSNAYQDRREQHFCDLYC